jgi:hypothetical protein
MFRTRFALAVVYFCFGLLLLAGTAAAQSDRGTVAGTVLDSSGAAVANAQISVTSTETGATYSATSGPTGGFRIQDVRVGLYNISASAPGFKTEKKTGVVVQINSTASVEFALQLGDVKETLTVIADAPSLQTESSDIGTVVGQRQIEDLPLALSSTGQSNLRSVETFVFLTPGTTGPGTDDSNGIFESKLSGGQNFSTEVLLDGASITHAELGSTFDENAPSVEALSEFKVTTSTIPAEFGRTSGGIESFTTRSGGNAFHGTALALLRNDKFNANSWQNNFNHAAKPRDHKKDFGGSLGGPVWIPKLYNGHDKTFFFFEWEQYRNNQGFSSITTLPTDAERTGDFSALLGASTGVLNPCDGNNPVLKGQIFDPSTTRVVGGVTCRSPFPGNKITTSPSKVAQNVLSFLRVHPNRPGLLNGLQNNFLFDSTLPILDTTMSFRIDENLGTRNKFFFSYSSRDQEQINGTPALPAPLDPNFYKSRFAHYVRFGWDDTISSSLLNHLNIGFNRLYDPSQGVSFTGQDWAKTLGITGASGFYFPQFSFNGSPIVGGYQGFGSGSADIAIPNSLIVSDSVSWVKGRHSTRFGFEWRHSQFSRFNNANTSPDYSFQNFQTAFTPNNSDTGDPFASFLLGLPNEESLRVSSVIPRWNQNYYAAYAQDDFKLRKDLTINIGVRYEVDTPRHEAHGAQSVLDLAAPNPGNAAVPISPAVPGALIYGSNATGAKTYFKDFGPRLGFAYAPARLFGWFPDTVVRGGYGIFYTALSYSDFGDSLTSGTTASPDFQSADKFTPVQSMDQGFPSFPPPSNVKDPALLNGGNGGDPVYVGADYGRPGRVQNWSLEVQHQLLPDLILSVGYIGTHATRLHSNLAQINSLNPKYYSLGTALNDSVTSAAGQATLASLGVTVPSWFVPLYGSGGQVGQLLRPFPQYRNISSSCCLENLGQSTYNALQAKLERRFRNGLNLLASYTFSKTLTDADTTFPVFTGFNSNVFGAQNPYNLKAEKSVSYQDVPHALVVSYLYELPAGPGKKYLSHGAASKVLGGWQIGGVHRYQSGTPVVINEFANSPNFTGGNFRFSRLPGVSLMSTNASSFQILNGSDSGCSQNANGTWHANSTNNFFNCAAFLQPDADSLVAQRGYVFGNLPVAMSGLRNPGYVNEDFAIVKRTTLFESHILIFKVDIPNAFNRHVFGRRDGNIFSNTFGVPGGGNHNVLNAARQLQLTLRYQF